jgi:hypothetical protein
MPKLFRRSWERQRQGKRGAISNVKVARNGTNGAISGTASTPSANFVAVGAAFTAGDIGRRIRLLSTGNNQRYDGLYIIDSIIDSDTCVLRYNHNISGVPQSLAVFRDIASSITWKILESCTFTVSGDDDTIEDFQSGCFITIDAPTNTGNKGTWEISHRTSSTSVILTKGHVMFPADYVAGQNQFYIDHGFDFVAETDMKWYLHDRQAFNGADLTNIYLQALIDIGWTVFQVRGPNATLGTVTDIILRSLGEDNTGISGGKAMFLRFMTHPWNRSGTQPNQTYGNWWFSLGVWHHWDPTQTATAPGNGVGNCLFNANDGAAAANTVVTGNNGTIGFGTIEDPMNQIGRGGLPATQAYYNYSIFGDRDEFWGYTNTETMANFHSHFGLSHLKLAGGANPNVVLVTAPFAAGSNIQVNVGTVDVTALNPPYNIGDNITFIGRKTTTTAEYVWSTSITGFNNTDPNNRKVIIGTADTAMGNGPDTLKCQFGEDPFPVCVHGMSSTSDTYRMHNVYRLANATGRDYDATNQGTSVGIWGPLTSYNEINPNRRSGKWGIQAIYINYSTTAEIRGRLRYQFRTVADRFPLYKKMVMQNGDVYVMFGPIATSGTGDSWWIGPMTKTMANVS